MARTKTYTPDFTTTRDQIRVKIGDTDTNDMLLYDDELAQAYAEGGSILAASILACRWCIAKLAREFDKSIGKMSTSRSQRHAAFLTTLETLRAESRETTLGWAIPTISYTNDTGEPGEFDGTAPPIYEPCDVTRPQWTEPES